MSNPLLLDTDILSALMKKDDTVLKKAHDYLLKYRIFMFSVITKYEILRGLKFKNAKKQIERFLAFCEKSIIIPVDDEVVLKASDIYADLMKKGKIINDADILIGSTALVNGYGVVTNNYKHFVQINDLLIENWLKK